MPFVDETLGRARPAKVSDVDLPRREQASPSPGDWRDEVLYFLLPDRFSDGGEGARPLLDRDDLAGARPVASDGRDWRWDRWAESGGGRFQGGTIPGIASKLGYLKGLGVTALWVGPIFKQRGHLDTYHGYGIQDFLDVDPRFGTRDDLVGLVSAAHEQGLRVILDVIFNHSGSNWIYPEGTPGGRERPDYNRADRYSFGNWRGDHGQPIDRIRGDEDGAWPDELQDTDRYTRAGRGDLGAGGLDDPDAEHKRSDFEDLREFHLESPGLLDDLARCYKYWIALTDCDGFRIDTLKHVTFEQARNFCGAIKEFATNLGKRDFFLVGEIAGGDFNADRYLDVIGQNLNAALDIGEMRLKLTGVAKGLIHPSDYFQGFDPGRAVLGSHRNIGHRHVSILDDHDHVFGEKVRFSADASSDHQVVAGVALQLLTLGIPCIYYGTEQAFAGPEASERGFLPGYRWNDAYLREAMFGPEHPRRPGTDGLAPPAAGLDPDTPGFGPFGTSGRHCFDHTHPAYRRIAAVASLRQRFPVLRAGRQYQRPLSLFGGDFLFLGPGELIAWSRILDDEEALCIINGHGTEARGGDVLIDAGLNPNSPVPVTMTVILNTAEAAGAPASHRVGTRIPVRRRGGIAFVEIRDLPPSEVLVLTNRP